MRLNAKSGIIAILAAGGVGCIVALGIYLGMITPRNAAITQVEMEIVAKEKELASAVSASHPSTKAQLREDCSAALTSLGKYVIGPEDRMDVAMQIGELAESTGLSEYADAYRPQTSGKGKIGSYRIEITFKATYNEVASFIYALESHDPIIFVDSFSISYSSSRIAQHDVAMGLVVLVRPDDDLGSSLMMTTEGVSE
jgi:hypothetical protein